MTASASAVAGPSRPCASASASAPLTKNARRRLKKKQQKEDPPQPSAAASQSQRQPSPDVDKTNTNGSSLIDDASELRIDADSEAYRAFSNVLARYQPTALADAAQPSKGEVIYSDDDLSSAHDSAADDDDDDSSHPAVLSKRKHKKLQRLSVAELKQLVRRPEVVEWTDVTSSDPRLLVHLKCVRNSVPIPPHWGTKRDYLQNKRGMEKPAYRLPTYIADTGIATMKDALKEKEAEQSLKQKTRERMQPKMGKLDIDYNRLYDAFFKFQHKPSLTPYGDTYYEGKEYETKYKDKRPGQLSAQLVEALSIPPLAPPPWLIAMQRFGPPPSYTHLQIPGLNAPLPEGAQWGFHPGGWGRPPVDEYGNPLYANVLATQDVVDADLVDPVLKDHWGQLEPEESDPEQEADEEDEREPETEEQEQEAQVEDASGLQSVATETGVETPSFLELRKDSRLDTTLASSRSLYTVLPERAASSSGQLLASERVYDIATHTGVLGEERGRKRAADAVDVAVNPDELDGMDKASLEERYEQRNRDRAHARYDTEGVAQMRDEMQREREKEQRRKPSRRA